MGIRCTYTSPILRYYLKELKEGRLLIDRFAKILGNILKIEENIKDIKQMKELQSLVPSCTKVLVLDESGNGGAHHEYIVVNIDTPKDKVESDEVLDVVHHAIINFQSGPIKENGVNGCQNEDLLKIVIDRLQCFQAGQYSCRENALALTHIQEALMWLERRTLERQNRGVEGLNIK